MAVLYMFLDEAGDFDFSPSGSKYFTLTALTTGDPYSMAYELHTLKHELIETAPDFREIEYFHAHQDPPPIRKRVFDLLGQYSHYRVDAVTFPKNVIHKPLRTAWHFYPHAARLLLPWVLERVGIKRYERVVVILDRLSLERDREAFLKAIKSSVKTVLTRGQRYDVWMHQARSHPLLQAVDYFSWAIFRRRERGDDSYYRQVSARVNSDFLFYTRVSHRYYQKNDPPA